MIKAIVLFIVLFIAVVLVAETVSLIRRIKGGYDTIKSVRLPDMTDPKSESGRLFRSFITSSLRKN